MSPGFNDNNSECLNKGSITCDKVVYDEVDFRPKHLHVTNLDICALLTSIFSHIIDVAFDIHLAYRYYHNNQTTYFGLTLVFILFPAFVNTIVSTKMYVMDEDSISVAKMATKRWTIRIFVLFFQLAPILRYYESLSYALKARQAEKAQDYLNQRKYYELMLKEDSDVALLRVFECFLEAAPQQVLQTTILLVDTGQGWTFQLFSQVGSIGSSLFSMAWSMASYHRTIRFAQENKDNISWPGTVLQFLWHYMVTVSRILSISVAASHFPLLTVMACVGHWFAMTVWLALTTKMVFCVQPNDTPCAKRMAEVLFCSILGMVYIFTYITPHEGRTRNHYIAYYLLCFCENIGAVMVWATAANAILCQKWYFYPLIVCCIVPFVLGMGFMILYYQCFHPKVLLIKTVSEEIPSLPPNNMSSE